MGSINNPRVARTLAAYPERIRQRLKHLRQLILEVALATPDIGPLEETLKWGQPSYLAKSGSTVRIDWKASGSEYYAVYFNCNTKLIATFAEVYSELFSFEDNRAIVFHQEDTIPTDALKHCIAVALQYHKLKHLPLLGM